MNVGINLLPIKTQVLCIHIAYYLLSISPPSSFLLSFSCSKFLFPMDACRCTGSLWSSNNTLAKYQLVFDLFISVAYFSIPMELLYLSRKSSLAPYRRILLQFGSFLVFCGATHFINLWSITGYKETVETVQTVTKGLCAVISCATAISLIGMMHEFVDYKLELYLKNKASELDTEKGLVKNQASTGKTEY